MKPLLLIAIAILAVGCGAKDESTTETKPVEEKVVEVKDEIKPEESVAVNQPKPEGVNYDNIEDREDVYYVKGLDTPYTGKTYALHQNGQKSEEGNYKDGKRDGLWTSWHENGKKKKEGNYKDGKRDGLWTSWYDNEQKKKEGNYKDGTDDGLWTIWHENGQKGFEGNYKDGKRDGLWGYWSKNGQKQQEENYKDGERISEKFLKNKGELVGEDFPPPQQSTKNPDESLYDATLLGETEKVKQAIADGADVNTKGAFVNAVVGSLDSGDNEIVEMFISNGANVNAKDDKGLTALDIIKSLSGLAAVSKKLRTTLGKTDDDIPVAELLRKHGAKTSEELKASD